MARVTKAALQRIAVRQIGAYSRNVEANWLRFSIFRSASETGEHCEHVVRMYEIKFLKVSAMLSQATSEAKKVGLIAE